MHAFFHLNVASMLGPMKRSLCACLSAQLLWKYSKGAVALRLRFLQQAEGVQARTALVQDIPGVHFGTLMHRADTTVLRVLPGIVKEPLKKTVSRVVDVGNKGLKATTGRINNALVSRCVRAQLAHTVPRCTSARQSSDTCTCALPTLMLIHLYG